MEISLAVLAFFAILGLLAVLYTANFRRRALSLGRERLIAALERTVSGEGEAGERELRQGVQELEKRLRRASYGASAFLAALLAACVALAALSMLPELCLALAGVGFFLVSCLFCFTLLRDIPREIARKLDQGGG